MAGLLYYATYKYVLLKDIRLGLFYYILALLILLYSILEIFVRKGYMEFDTRPQGTIRLMLSDDFANKEFSADSLPYCSGSLPCEYLDPWDLNWPQESRAVTITTFAKDRIQQRSNYSNSPLDEYQLSEEKMYFTQAPEYIVLKLDHAVVASHFTDSRGRESLAASHRQLRGFLVDTDGNTLRELSSPKLGRPDKVTLEELLQAAGVSSLEEESDIVNAKGRSFRERGCILRVTIFYQNWFSTWIGTSNIEYRYSVRRVPFVDYSTKQAAPLMSRDEVLSEVGTHSSQWRLLKKRYAIRVEFEQAGSLGQFSLPTLLLKLVAGMGLLTLAATIIDSLALYVLPDKGRYRESVYEESPELRPTLKLAGPSTLSRGKTE